MEKLRKYLNLKINGKIKKSFSEDKNKIKLINDIEKTEVAIGILSLLGSGLLVFSGISTHNIDPTIIFAAFLTSGFGIFNIYHFHLKMKKRKEIIKKIKNGDFDIGMMNDIYQNILEKHFLNKEEIENFLNEIREIGLEEKDIDYCIKKTMTQTDLDLGNLFFMFLLYQNLEELYRIKNDDYLDKKLNFQKIKESINVDIKIRESLKKEKILATK